MKKGFELLIANSSIEKFGNSEIHKKFGFRIPNLFYLFSSCFMLGEDKFNIEKFYDEKIGDDFLIPITNVLYCQKNINININYFFSLDDALETWQSGENLEPAWTNNSLLRIGVLSAPVGGSIYVSCGEIDNESIYIDCSQLINNESGFLKIEDNIFQFIQKIESIKNTYQFSESDFSKLYKNWGEDFWRVRDID